MISKLKIFERILNFLLIFLIPTQLALHFWPSFAFIFGIRIDYLAPAIYLTDILFLLLVIPWAFKLRRKIAKDFGKHKYLLALLLMICFINLIFSQSFYVSAIKWVKVFELLVFGYYVAERKDVFTVKDVAKTIFFSLLFFCFVGLLQLFNGRTSGNIFYLIGERSFSIYTPGIALVNMFGRNLLRVYSTFPHPNSLAGFLGASIIYFLFNLNLKNKLIKFFGLTIIFLTFMFTFSLSAHIGLSICLPFYFLLRKNIYRKKIFSLLLLLLFLASLGLSLFARPLLSSRVSFSQSFSQRLELANISGRIFSRNWITGSGLNTFIITGTAFSGRENGVWLLQPVHNLYLLIFSESGVLGIALVCLLVMSVFIRCIKTKNKWGILIMIFVLVTSLFDHYWFTIQQNLLLLALITGLSFREK